MKCLMHRTEKSTPTWSQHSYMPVIMAKGTPGILDKGGYIRLQLYYFICKKCGDKWVSLSRFSRKYRKVMPKGTECPWQ